jgi:hypothetical protein
MPKLRVHNLSISLDGYAARPNQRIDHPFGEGDPQLHDWMFATRTSPASPVRRRRAVSTVRNAASVGMAHKP